MTVSPDVLHTVVRLLGEDAAEVDRTASFPTRGLNALRENGLMGLLVPEKHGGAGGGLADLQEVAQALSGACLSTGLIWAMHCQQVDILVRHASRTLRRAVLPRVAAGEIYLASVTTGPATHGDLRSTTGSLVAEHGTIRLDRTAPIVTGGMHADAFLTTIGDEDGVSLVYADRAELEVTRLGGWDTLGMRGTESVPLHLVGRASLDAVVGGRRGFGQVASDSMVPAGHIGWSACWLGAARSALSALVRHVAREHGAAAQTPSAVLTQERLARTRLELELVSAYLARTVAEVESVRAAGERMDTPARQLHLNTLKIAASELTFSAVDRMVQVAGLATGYTSGSPIPLERTFRDLRSAALNFANDRLLSINGMLSLVERSVTLI